MPCGYCGGATVQVEEEENEAFILRCGRCGARLRVSGDDVRLVPMDGFLGVAS